MNGTHSIVIHRHKTSHPHDDLGLEMDGGLRSWILPRGFPIGDEKRLAIEDRVLGFVCSGTIIGDGYGLGEVEIWDKGVYRIEQRSNSKIVFIAQCERFSGRFILLLPSWGGWSKRRLWVLFRN